MKNKLVISIILSQLFYANMVRAQSGSHGGDPACEGRFQEISRDLLEFTHNADKTSQLNLPAGESSTTFILKMGDKLTPYLDKSINSEVTFDCVDYPVYVGTEEKTCRWRDPKEDHTIKDGKIHIECNYNRFVFGVDKPTLEKPLSREILEPMQVKDSIHEWASIANLETNVGSISDYFVSQQITATGGWVYQFKIGVKSRVKFGKIIHHNKTIEISYEQNFDEKKYTINFYLVDGSDVSLIGSFPSAVEGAENWYDMEPYANHSLVFGFGGFILYPTKKEVWNGIPLFAQQGPSEGDYRKSKRIISDAMISGKDSEVSRNKFKTVVKMIKSLNGTHKNINHGLPQGAHEGIDLSPLMTMGPNGGF